MSAIQSQIRELLQEQYGGARVGAGRRGPEKHLSAWQMHVAQVRHANPGMSPKEAMQLASRSYHRQGSALVGGARRAPVKRVVAHRVLRKPRLGGSRVGGALIGGYGTKKGAKKAVRTKKLISLYQKGARPKNPKSPGFKEYAKLHRQAYPKKYAKKAPKRKVSAKRVKSGSKSSIKSAIKKLDAVRKVLKKLE